MGGRIEHKFVIRTLEFVCSDFVHIRTRYSEYTVCQNNGTPSRHNMGQMKKELDSPADRGANYANPADGHWYYAEDFVARRMMVDLSRYSFLAERR